MPGLRAYAFSARLCPFLHGRPTAHKACCLKGLAAPGLVGRYGAGRGDHGFDWTGRGRQKYTAICVGHNPCQTRPDQKPKVGNVAEKRAKEAALNIYEYVNHLEYLRDWRICAKKVNPRLSHRHIAVALGQPNARSIYGNLESGRKRISSEMARRLSLLMAHTEEEQIYFQALIRYGQAETAQEKELYFDQLIRLNRTPHLLLSPEAYAYFKEWYNPVIRALLDVIPFKSNYRELANNVFPPVSVEQTRNSIKLLKELGLIARDEDGYWRPTDKVIAAEGKAHHALIKNYQLQCLDNAQRALIAGMDTQMRDVTMTLSLSKAAIRLVDQKLSQFKLLVRSIAHKDEARAQAVYHMNITLFPHTQELDSP